MFGLQYILKSSLQFYLQQALQSRQHKVLILVGGRIEFGLYMTSVWKAEVYILQISRLRGGGIIFVPRVKLGENIRTLVIFRKFWWFFEKFNGFYLFLRKL